MENNDAVRKPREIEDLVNKIFTYYHQQRSDKKFSAYYYKLLSAMRRRDGFSCVNILLTMSGQANVAMPYWFSGISKDFNKKCHVLHPFLLEMGKVMSEKIKD